MNWLWFLAFLVAGQIGGFGSHYMTTRLADWSMSSIPVRESLGAALLMHGENADAEKVFREDLNYHPRNPRSLFGLQQALKAQGKEYDAGFVQKQLQSSWKGGSTQLKLDDLV